MPIWILLMVLLVAPGAFAQSYVVNNVDTPTQQVNYTDIITRWLKVQHPQEAFIMKVGSIKPILTNRGMTGSLAFQVNVFFSTHAQSYILVIKDGAVLAFIDAGAPVAAEEDEEDEELFLAKDQA